MNILTRIGDLYFDQKKFFEEEKSKKVGWAALIVLISGLLSAFYAYLVSTNSTSALSELPISTDIIAVSAVISAIIMAFVSWIIVSLLFFICLKLFGHSDCNFRDTLRVQGYVVGLLILEVVIQILISFIGTPAPIATLLFTYVFLAWSIPVWFFGFKAISTKISRKELWTSILIPVVIMAIIDLLTAGLLV